MEVKIQSVHFDATEKLRSYIDKKLSKVEKFSDEVISAQVQLKVEKPEVAMNKYTSIKVLVKQGELFAEKVCDTFEEGVSLCVDSLLRQLEKYKEFLTEEGEVYLKTDDDNLFNDSLNYFREEGFNIIKKTYDLENEPNFWENIETEHEKMFKQQGIKIKASIAKKRLKKTVFYIIHLKTSCQI